MAGTDTRGRPADATVYGVRPAFSGRGSGAGGASGSPGGGLFAGFPSNNDGLFAGFDPDRNIRNAQQAQEEEKKKNLAQKLIAKLREEGIPEELIQRELANYPTAQALLGALQNIMSIISRLREAGGFSAAAQESKDYIIDAAGRVVNAAGDIIADPKGEIKRRLIEGREQVGERVQNVGGRIAEIGSNEDVTRFLPGGGRGLRGIARIIDRAGEKIKSKADGGIMSLKDGGESDLRNIAKQRSAEVYGDPVMFERFAPSPLQQMDPSFRQSQFFMPVGQVPNFNMGIMGLPGQMYANYYPAGSVGQMNPINKQIMGMPGGAPMPPPPGSEPTTPPPSQDTGMTGEIWDKPYEEAIPRPKRADFADGPFQGKKGSEAFKRALEAWNRNKKIWDSFETGAERKKYYLSGLDNLNFADGGSTNFPRKNGQISGPGTERSDDIPAMLSDGEFVVNAKAVRGIGSLMGSGKPKSKAEQRREGARAMYALQSAGEKASGLRG